MRDSLLPKIDRLVRGTLSSWQDGQKVILLDQTKKMTFELIVKQLISEDPSEWTEALRREYLFLIDGFFTLPLPSFLSSYGTYGKSVRSRAKVAEMFRDFVRERRAEKREVSKDMLDELLMMENGLDDEGMVDFLLSMLLAGYDTPSTIMTTAIKFLTENPLALAQLKEEHEPIMRAKKQHDDPLEWSDYQSMTFTQCIINETLRLTKVVVGVHRRATTDIHFKGYTFPKGSKVFPWLLGVHLNAENF